MPPVTLKNDEKKINAEGGERQDHGVGSDVPNKGISAGFAKAAPTPAVLAHKPQSDATPTISTLIPVQIPIRTKVPREMQK